MGKADEISYTEHVYDVLRSAETPLTFQEIFEEVDRRRPITTRNPKATIRNALTQGRQLTSLGDGRYGYLPKLLRGSLIRLPLTEKKPANHPLIFTDELRHALWPSFFEIQKRSNRRPVTLRLPDGIEVVLPLQFLGTGTWGSALPEELRRYLVASGAAAGDSLLIRVADAEAARYEASLERRLKRDEAAVAERNRELANAADQLLRKSSRREMMIWDLVVMLLARGLYRSEVAPDPLEEVLRADSRFVYTGLMAWTLTEAVTPETRASIRERERVEAKLSEPAEDFGGLFSIQSARASMERAFADIQKALSKQEFDSIEEADAYLQGLLSGGKVPSVAAESPLEEAQELMYDAWESTSPRERIRLARKALEVSPDCADAYVLLAEESARSAREEAELYAKGVEAGKRAIGEEAFQECVGRFWGVIETRPYMRARLGLAQALWAMGRKSEAVEHAWDMLRLNPGDNQGIRYVLLSWLLETGGPAEKLLDQYEDDAAATWQYGRALSAFRTEGDTPRARELLSEALRRNPYVPAYLLGRKRMPRSLPSTVGFGDESEAVDCAAGQGSAWRETPGALEWLRRVAHQHSSP